MKKREWLNGGCLLHSGEQANTTLHKVVIKNVFKHSYSLMTSFGRLFCAYFYTDLTLLAN